MLLTPALALILTSQSELVEASPDLIYSDDAEVHTVDETDYEKLKSWATDTSGTLQIDFDLRNVYGSETVYGRVYKNGSPVGTERSTDSDTYQTYSENIAGWVIGDNIEIWAMADVIDDAAYVRNFRVYGPPSVYPTKPVLYLPSDGDNLTDNTTYFEWENGENATSHRLLVDNDSDFSSPNENRTFTTENSYTITFENALPDDNYSWKVIALNAAEDENTSAIWTFLMSGVQPSVVTENASNIGVDNATLNATIDYGGYENVDVAFDYKSDVETYTEAENEDWSLSDHYYTAPTDPAIEGDWGNRTPIKYVAANDSSQEDKDFVEGQGENGYQCDGVADQITINSALDAASAVEGKVYLFDGTYLLDMTVSPYWLVFSNNVSLVGENRENTFIKQTSPARRIIYVSEGKSVENVLIENLTLLGQGRTVTGETVGIFVTNARSLVLKNLTIKDVPAIAIYFEVFGTASPYVIEDCWVINCDIRNIGHAGIIFVQHYSTTNGYFRRSENNYILNNTIVGAAMGGPIYGGDGGIVLYSQKHCVVANNIIENCGKSRGIGIVHGGAQVDWGCENILVQGNRVQRNNLTEISSPAIIVNGKSGQDNQTFDVILRGNDINQFYGITLENYTENCVLDNNSIYNTVIGLTEKGTGHTIENNTEVHWENSTTWVNKTEAFKTYSRWVANLHRPSLYGFRAKIKYDTNENMGNVSTFQIIGVGQPQLYYPENDTHFYNGGSINFQWTNGTGANYHRLVVNDNNENFGGDNVVDINVNVPENSYEYTLTTPDNYWWKVIAVWENSENESETWIFAIHGLPSVENLYITDTENVVADDLASQTQYKFWVEIEDNDTLADIENVTLVVYLDNENLPDAEENHYTFRWTRDGGFEEVGPDNGVERKSIDIDDNISSALDSRLPSQHKMFYLQGRYWSFYVNRNDNIIIKRTSVDGESWSALENIGTIEGPAAYFDVAYDGENFHFARLKGSCYYRKGTPQENGDINWLNDWQAAFGSILWDPHIRVDYDGYPWIGFLGTGDRPRVSKSDNKDGTWQTSSGFPYELQDIDPGLAIPVPLANGQVYVVYGWWSGALDPVGDDNRIRGKLWNGSSWENYENVSISLPSGDYYSMWQASGEGNDVHVLYLSKAENIMYRKRTWGSGWGDEITLETGVNKKSTPSLTIDESTGDLYVFWAKSYHVYYKKYDNESGTWDAAIDWIDESADEFPGAGPTSLRFHNTVGTASKVYENRVMMYYLTKQYVPHTLNFSFFTTGGVHEHLIVENCVAGNDSLSTDNIIFAIEFGEDATVTADDNWDVFITVYDSAGNEDNRFFLNQFDIVSAAQWNLLETWTGDAEAPAAWQEIENWTGTVEAPVEWQLIETWSGSLEAPAAWQLIETWSGAVEAVSQWNLLETWSGTVQAPSVWQLIETWSGTIEAPSAWSLIEEWSGTVQAPTAWQLIESWDGTVQAPAAWDLIETWSGTVEAPTAWGLIETWTGTVEAFSGWQLIETWSGTVQAPTAWLLIESWSGTVEAPSEWQQIESWTGTVEAPSEWTLIESWTGAIEALVGWQLIETWDGTVEAFSGWMLIETWTGAVEAFVGWQTIESWDGTTIAPAQWEIAETWTGTIRAPSAWQLVETWSGTVEAPTAWLLIESWSGTIQAPTAWNLIETWSGGIEAPVAWQSIETWAGTVQAPVAWQLVETWTGSIESPTAWQLISTWSGTVQSPSVWDLIESWMSTVQAPSEWSEVESWSGTVIAVGWTLIESWNGTIETHGWLLIETWTGGIQTPAIYAVSISITPAENSGILGDTLTYTVIVANIGGTIDNYDLTSSDALGWTTYLDNDNFINVSSGENRETTLNVGLTTTGTHEVIVTATGTGASDSDNCTAISATAPDVIQIGDGNLGLAIGLMAIGLALCALCIALILIRKRREEEGAA